MKVHYPKLYNMAHLFTFNVFTDFKGSNNYILFILIETSLVLKNQRALLEPC